MKEKRFKIGDKVTYKPLSQGKGLDGYYYGGEDQGGYMGTVQEYEEYEPEQDCWKIRVSCKDEGHDMWGYKMLESEFIEYDTPVDGIRVSDPNIFDKVVRGKDWDWNIQDQGSVYGVIKEVKDNKWCTVEWIDSNGKVINVAGYRCGYDGKYDLYYYTGPQIQQPKSEMELIQEEAKRRFPIGCQFIHASSTSEVQTLILDDETYRINEYSKAIHAHVGAGCLYLDGKWAERIDVIQSSGTSSTTVLVPTEWTSRDFIVNDVRGFKVASESKTITHQRPVLIKTVRKTSKLVIK